MRRRLQTMLLDQLARPARNGGPREPGYTVLIPAPQDMPFLLRLSLDNLLSINLEHCRKVLVIPDGRASSLAPLESIVAQTGDPRVQLIPLSPLQRLVADRVPRADGGANFRHWLTIHRGLEMTLTAHAFLHDIDAFWISSDCIERQYERCSAEGLWTLGVTQRWDPFFVDQGIALPATWELMFEVAWARGHAPTQHKGGPRSTPAGVHTFDTMLWSQFSDLASGKVAVLDDVASVDYVHFNGTITTFRTFRRLTAANATDELFRLLLLALWESAAANEGEVRQLPPVRELARGLTEPAAPVVYQGDTCRRGYAEFRHMVSRLAQCAAFASRRLAKIADELEPFDAYFSFDPARPYEPAIASGEVRASGLQLSGNCR